MVLTPFDVGGSTEKYDLLVVDEAHRLNHRANQASGTQNARFAAINQALFGSDADHYTQLDWIAEQSRHQIYLLDTEQSVRPADLPARLQQELVAVAAQEDRHYRLATQMRMRAGEDFVGYVRSFLRGEMPQHQSFAEYDFRLFDDLGAMHDAIRAKDAEFGLSRLVAGYAWEWRSKKDRDAFDIEIDGRRLRWNSSQKDWIASAGAVEEVGSIHTVQGYDLNYVGVVIGPDLRWDAASGRMVFDRAHYFDKKGMENNPRLGITYTDDDVLCLVRNIYAVLLTRGVRGAYVYVCDPALRERLRPLM